MTDAMLRFTATARKGLSMAQREAEFEKWPVIEVRHLLMGFVQLPVSDSPAAHVLNELGLTLEKLRTLERGQPPKPESPQPELSQGVKKVLERAATVARQRDDHLLSSVHLLDGILQDADVGHMFETFGASLDSAQIAVKSLQNWAKES